jgi:hypothetical protein
MAQPCHLRIAWNPKQPSCINSNREIEIATRVAAGRRALLHRRKGLTMAKSIRRLGFDGEMELPVQME